MPFWHSQGVSRRESGHWEGDSIEGKSIDQDGIHTEAERLSRFFLARKVDTIDSQQTITVQKQMFTKLPAPARRSTTLDNGREHHLHFQLQAELGMETFFADPYSSWQRGTNENTNGLLRRYLPKGTSFKDLSQAEVDDIVAELKPQTQKVLWVQYAARGV